MKTIATVKFSIVINGFLKTYFTGPYFPNEFSQKLSHIVDVHVAIVMMEFAMCHSEFFKHS